MGIELTNGGTKYDTNMKQNCFDKTATIGTICIGTVRQRPFQFGDALGVVADAPSVKHVMHANFSWKK